MSATFLLAGGSVAPAALNWVVAGACGLSGVGLCFFDERRPRARIDAGGVGGLA